MLSHRSLPVSRTGFLSSINPDDKHPVKQKEKTMENEKYEGLFAKTPESSMDTIWGSTETHREYTWGPETIVKKDHWGTAEIQDPSTTW
jgi:hypothetical protein